MDDITEKSVRALAAAVVLQAFEDISYPLSESCREAREWLAGEDYPIFAQVLGIPEDGEWLVRSGKASQIAGKLRQCKIEIQRQRKGRPSVF